MITKGDIIKTLREQKGLTQSELADGVCSQTTLSRAESGKQEMSFHVFSRLLEEMGENLQNYTLAMTTTEKEAIELGREITELLNQEQYADAEKLLDELEALKELDEDSYNFAKFSRIVIAAGRGLPQKEAIEQLHKVFKWLDKLSDKKGRYQRHNYSKHIFSKTRLQVLSFLAICYVAVEEAQAIEIFYLQKLYLERIIADRDTFANAYTAVTHNLSKQLALSKKHDEALAIAEEGIAWCDKYGRSDSLDALLLNKACILVEIDSLSAEGIELLNLCYLSFKRKSQPAVYEQIRGFALLHNVSIFVE